MSVKHNNGLAWPTNGKSNVRYAKYLITVITLIFPTEGVDLAIASGSASGLSLQPRRRGSATIPRGLAPAPPWGSTPAPPRHGARPRLTPPGSTSATTPRHGARLRPPARASATPPPRPRPRHGARPRPPSRPKGLGLSDPPPPTGLGLGHPRTPRVSASATPPTGLGHGHPQGALPPHGARSPHLTGLGLGTLLMGSALALGLGTRAQPQTPATIFNDSVNDMYKYFHHVHTFYDLYSITILA